MKHEFSEFFLNYDLKFIHKNYQIKIFIFSLINILLSFFYCNNDISNLSCGLYHFWDYFYEGEGGGANLLPPGLTMLEKT